MKAFIHCQRVSNVNSKEIIFDLHMEATTNLKEFIANRSNKSRFISKLKPYFENKHINVRQAEADADILIVNTAIELANEISTPVIIC